MTTTQTHPSAASVIRGESALRLPARRPRRSQTLLAAALVIGGAGLSAGWVARADDTRAVVSVSRRVPAGQRVVAADLTVLHLGGDTAGFVPADRADSMVGRTAVGDLVPGSLLTTNMVSDASVPEDVETLVGVALRPGAFPTELVAGMRVRVLVTPADERSTTVPHLVASERARVVSVVTDQQSGATVATLAVPSDDADAVARASAANAVSLVVLIGEAES